MDSTEFKLTEFVSEPQSRIVGSNCGDCANSQVHNPYVALTNEQLVELRSNLEIQLHELDTELKMFGNHSSDNEEFLYEKYEYVPNCDRSLYDVEVDRDYILSQIEEVDKCLSQRNLNWLEADLAQSQI